MSSILAPSTTIFDRVDTLTESVGAVPWQLEDILTQAVLWRASAEEAYFWDDDRSAFDGRCVNESEDFLERLKGAVENSRNAELRAFHYNGLAKKWHVAVVFDGPGGKWLIDLTADQFSHEDVNQHRLVFAPLCKHPEYGCAPQRW